DRSGQWVHRTGIERGEIGDRRPRLELAVERVAGLERHLLALADLDDGRDIRVKAVVAAARLLAQPLLPIDADRVHGSPPLGSVESIHHGGMEDTEKREGRRSILHSL